MSEIVIEIAQWPASEAYKADISVANPGLEVIVATKGALKVWYGLQHEDKSTAYLIIAWDSLASHQALIADKDAYGRLGAGIGPALGGAISLYHVKFNALAIPEEHLNAPVTELAVQNLREDKTPAELEAIFFNPEFSAGGKVFDAGKVVEKENQYVLVKGWDSVEAHAATVSGDERLGKFVTIVNQLAVPEIVHVKLTSFK